MAETRGKNKNLVEAGNPRLLKKEVRGGTEYSLYLEYQLGYNRDNGTSIRKKETLSLYLIANPRTPVERQQNKETLALAKKIQFERSQELLDNKEGYRLKKKDAINLLDYFEQFAKTANVADRLVLVGALNNFKDFLGKKYPQYANWIEAKNLSSDMMQKYVDYLVENHKGQGAETYYKRFKRMIPSAYKRVPVMLLIAMSPISVSDSFSKAPVEYECSGIELMEQQRQKAQSNIIGQKTVDSNYEHCTFIKYDSDKVRNDAELLAFKYNYLSEGGYKGLLDGFFYSVCNTPYSDGRVLATYVGVADNKFDSDVRLCSIPSSFAKYIINFANSEQNNDAVKVAKKADYIASFGKDAIVNVPKIEDEINRVQDWDGTIRVINRPSEQNRTAVKKVRVNNVNHSQQANKDPFKSLFLLASDTKIVGNEKYDFKAYTSDANDANYEVIGFDYSANMKNGRNSKIRGAFQAICPAKTSDGQYIVVYTKVNADGAQMKNQICKVPSSIGSYLLQLAESPMNNNAIVTMSKKELSSVFGASKINNAPKIAGKIKE